MKMKDLVFRRGSNGFLLFCETGDVSAHELSFVVKPSFEITDYRVIDKLSSREGEITSDFIAGKNETEIRVNIRDEDTYSLAGGNFYYDLDDLTEGRSISGGIFILIPDVQTPFDNLGILPQSLVRMILLNPDEFEDNEFVIRKTVEGKANFGSIDQSSCREMLGINELDERKVDKSPGMGLSENNLSSQLKGDYDSAYAMRHSHSNMSLIDAVNQNLGSGANPQFNQLGVGRGCLGTWSLTLHNGLTTRTSTYIDWEGGNARIRENSFNLEFSNFDGSSLVQTFRTGASGNISYKPLTTSGMKLKTLSVSAQTTLTTTDHAVFVTTGSTDKIISLPVSGIPDGTWFIIKKVDSGSGRGIVQAPGGTVEGGSEYILAQQYSCASFIKSGAGYYVV